MWCRGYRLHFHKFNLLSERLTGQESLVILKLQGIFVCRNGRVCYIVWEAKVVRKKGVVMVTLVTEYFEVVENPQEADFALVGIKSPDGSVRYDRADLEKGSNGYVPISLQYKSYTAKDARETSLAGGSPLEDFINRTYQGKTVKTNNTTDMKLVNETKAKMGDKPVIVIVHVSKPMIFSKIELNASSILVHMGVQDQALMEIISGATEPSALLPFQMPVDMTTVEKQFEDVPRDMKPYVDTAGNAYDFAFGLNWNGVIFDERVAAYK
jgi:beta-glucosidase